VYAWLSRHPRLVDAIPAILLGLLGVPQTAVQPRPVLFSLLAAAMVVPVIFRRGHPVTVFAIVTAVGAVVVLLPGSKPTAADLAILIMLYTVAAYRPRRVSLPALAICVTGSVVGALMWVPGLGGSVLASILFVGPAAISWVLGDSMRYRRAYLLALEDRAARLEAERDAQAQVAAAAERARIARELHDVIAHNVSVMVVQADGAGYALQREPERTRQALAAISQTGRDALTEMRRLLGVLRDGDDGAHLAPQPGLAELRELVDQARSAGMSVSLTVEGEPRQLPEGAELAAYRVVQESLTNTRKHGGLAVAANVTLRFQPDSLLLQVTDNGRGAATAAGSAGHGLAGMRERIAMYGGTVQAGPLPDGGFRVTASLPVPRRRPERAGRVPARPRVTGQDPAIADRAAARVAARESASTGAAAARLAGPARPAVAPGRPGPGSLPAETGQPAAAAPEPAGAGYQAASVPEDASELRLAGRPQPRGAE
jgi:signal transduction histidine kinase